MGARRRRLRRSGSWQAARVARARTILMKRSGGEYEEGSPRVLRPWLSVAGTVVDVVAVPSPITGTLMDEKRPVVVAVASKWRGWVADVKLPCHWGGVREVRLKRHGEDGSAPSRARTKDEEHRTHDCTCCHRGPLSKLRAHAVELS